MSAKPSLFGFKDYKDYIRARIETSDKPRGLVSSYADAAGCQRTYFSQVINSHIHLTPDHALGLAEYWRLSDAEAKYFCLLVDHARAATVRLKNRIGEQLDEIKKNAEDLSKRFGEKSIEPGERELTYYSSWLYGAIHVLTSIPQFRTPEKIAERLSLPLDTVLRAMEDLEKHQFIRRENKKFVLGEGDIHIPKKSLLNSVNHGNWRTRAVLDAQNPDHSGVHYTSVASMSYEDYEKLKNLILEFIGQSRKIIAASPEQDLFCLTCDLFKV